MRTTNRAGSYFEASGFMVDGRQGYLCPVHDVTHSTGPSSTVRTIRSRITPVPFSRFQDGASVTVTAVGSRSTKQRVSIH